MTTENTAILEVNKSFYSIFTNRDIKGMRNLWSSQHDIAVIHPGWPPLSGRDAVISSWDQIMKNDMSPQVSCANASVNLFGDVAIVICTELLGDIELIASNIFIIESAAWKMIHHQAGPLPKSEIAGKDDILH